MNRLIFGLVAMLAFGAASAGDCPDDGEKKILPIEELEAGPYNQYVTEKRYMLARSESELEEVERLIGTSLDVDLEQQMVLAAFMGTRGSGGHSIEVTRAVETDSRVKAHVTLTSPGPECIVTMAFTSPYQVVALPRVDDKPLKIREREKTEHCRQ